MQIFVVALVIFLKRKALAQNKKYEERIVECVDCRQPVPD